MLVFYAAAGGVDAAAQRQRADLDAGPLPRGCWRDVVFRTCSGHTLRTAIVVTVGTLLLGYPVALALARAGRTTAAVMLVIVLLPFWTSVLVRSYAWMVLLGRHGLINEALMATGLIDTPLRLLNTPLAVHMAMIHILLPYMILPIANALRQIDPSLARAAAGLGAPPLAVFPQVILPLSMPGVAAACCWCSCCRSASTSRPRWSAARATSRCPC